MFDTANFKTVPIFGLGVLGETDIGREGGRGEGLSTLGIVQCG